MRRSILLSSLLVVGYAGCTGTSELPWEDSLAAHALLISWAEAPGGVKNRAAVPRWGFPSRWDSLARTGKSCGSITGEIVIWSAEL